MMYVSICISTCVFHAVQVNETINNILTTFNARIQAKDWLDDVTKQRCEQKVSVEGCVLSCPNCQRTRN